MFLHFTTRPSKAATMAGNQNSILQINRATFRSINLISRTEGSRQAIIATEPPRPVYAANVQDNVNATNPAGCILQLVMLPMLSMPLTFNNYSYKVLRVSCSCAEKAKQNKKEQRLPGRTATPESREFTPFWVTWQSKEPVMLASNYSRLLQDEVLGIANNMGIIWLAFHRLNNKIICLIWTKSAALWIRWTLVVAVNAEFFFIFVVLAATSEPISSGPGR